MLQDSKLRFSSLIFNYAPKDIFMKKILIEKNSSEVLEQEVIAK